MKKIFIAILVVFTSLNMSGCLMLAFAPTVGQLVGGAVDGDSKTTVDKSTITPGLRQALSNARSITFITSKDDKYAIHIAEYLEEHGGYIMTLVDANKAMPKSQRVRTMKKQCQQPNTDLVLLMSASETNVNDNNMLESMFAGRITTSGSNISNILSCKNNMQYSFKTNFQATQGMYSTNQQELVREVGINYAREIMKIGGKILPKNNRQQ